MKNTRKNVLLMASITLLLVMGTAITPIQSYASDEHEKTGDAKSSIKSDNEVDKKSANQKMDKDNFCYRDDNCQQANQGQQIVGKDNDATGFNDQSKNIEQQLDATTPPAPTTPSPNGALTVVKQVICQSNGGSPSDAAVCAFAENSDNFPQPSGYQITVTGSNPSPSTFPGNSTGNQVTLGPGTYTVGETLASTDALQTEMSATSITTDSVFSGDCNEQTPPSQTATGSITAGTSETCGIVNEIIITGGEVPNTDPATLSVSKTMACRSEGGQPSDQAVCAYALASANFPKPSEFSITVSGNNPSPSEFQGSTTPVDVTIGAGDYQVSENGLNVDYFPILIEMRASSATNELSFTGNCVQDSIQVSRADGSISSGGTQTCNLVNTIVLVNADVPQ